MKASGNPEQFAKEYVSPTEYASLAARQEMPQTQVHNAAPLTRGNTGAMKSDLKNYVAPTGKVNRESQYYKAGEAARAAGTNKFGAGGTFEQNKKNAPAFSDLIKNAPSANAVDNAAMKSHQYYRAQVEQLLGHPVDALSDEQVKELYIKKTGDESPYLNTGSNNPYYTPLMAEIDNAAAATVGDLPFASEAESEKTRDTSAYWDANRPEVHNVNPVPGYYASYFANKEQPKVSDDTNNFWAQSPENMILDTSEPVEVKPSPARNAADLANERGRALTQRYNDLEAERRRNLEASVLHDQEQGKKRTVATEYQMANETANRDQGAANLDRGAAGNGAQWNTERDRVSNGNDIASAIDQWQRNKGSRNALGVQTFNETQQYQALYNELLAKGLSKEAIMEAASNEEYPNLSPYDNMMLYYYAANH